MARAQDAATAAHRIDWGQVAQDYGMLIVLLLLGIGFSLQTVEFQHPVGEEAGRQVAEQILAKYGAEAHVIVIGQTNDEDRAFTETARSILTSRGATIIQVIHGNPQDARRAIEEALNDGQSIDAIATNESTSKWNIYDRFEGVGRAKVVAPIPYRWPNFLKSSNLMGIANQTAIYAIIAIGMTMVIISAGIDLSVGSLVALSAVATTVVIRAVGGVDAAWWGVLLGCCVGICACALAGSLNGAMVTLFQVPPFITTLAMMMMASGLAFRLSSGKSIDDLPDSFDAIDGTLVWGIPNAILAMFFLFLLAHLVMSRTIFGRYIYAVGGNYEAARLSGVPVKRVQFSVYLISGVLSGVVGILLASRLSSGAPTFGIMYELDVIAAVVVGGTSLMGGRGKMFGTLIGALIIMTIKNGMNLMNTDPFNQKIVLGAVLLLAVLIDLLKRRARAH